MRRGYHRSQSVRISLKRLRGVVGTCSAHNPHFVGSSNYNSVFNAPSSLVPWSSAIRHTSTIEIDKTHDNDSNKTKTNTNTTVPNINVGSTELERLTKKSQSLLSSEIGTLTQASILEITTALTSWHAQVMSSSSNNNPCNVKSFDMAESLFHRLVDEYEYITNRRPGGDINVDVEVPAVITLTTINKVLDTWRIINNAKAPTKQATKHKNINIANQISKEKEHENELFLHRGLSFLHYVSNASKKLLVGKVIEHPNHKSYNYIMDGYAKYGSVSHANDLLDEMMYISKNENQPQCYPDTITYNSLLSTHANAQYHYSSSHHQSNYQTQTHAQIQTQTENADRAQEILQNMMDLYHHTKNVDIQPDVISFSSVLAACANAASVSPTYAQDAEDILDHMMDLYQSSISQLDTCSDDGSSNDGGEWAHLKANEICYSTVVNAWSKSGVSDGADRAMNLMMKMQQSLENSSNGDDTNTNTDDEEYDHDGTNRKLKSMTAMIGAYANSNNVDHIHKAEDLFDKMMTMMQGTDNDNDNNGSISISLDPVVLTAFITCLAQSAGRSVTGDNGMAARKADAIVKQMEEYYENNDSYSDSSGKTNVNVRRLENITYNALISCWANSMHIDAGREAERVLDRMEDMYSKGDVGVKPNLITFSSVIQAFSNLKDGTNAERILHRLLEAVKKQDDANDLQLSIIPFSGTITAYARSGKPQEAERVLHFLKDLREKGMIDFDPDIPCYNGIISAFVNINNSRDGDNIQSNIHTCLKLLEEMKDMGMVHSSTYSIVIEGLCKTNGSWTEEKIVTLLDEMWDLYEKGNEEVKPSSVVYNSVINAFAKSRHGKTRKLAVKYLEELERKYEETHDPKLRPNTVSYNAAISSLTRAKNKHELQQAEALFTRMETLAAGKYFWIKPDSFSMTNVISAWANSDLEGSAQNAEAILNRMQAMYEDGNASMKPTTVAFGAVLNAWARSGNVERSEAIVTHMENLMNTIGFEELRPNNIIYNTLINSYGRSNEANASKRVEEILAKMEKLRDEGFHDASPTIITYNSVLQVYSRSQEKGTWNQEKGVYEKARDILKYLEEIKHSKPNLAPTTVTYTTFLNVLARARNEKKTLIAEAILHQMQSTPGNTKAQANSFTYDAILRNCAHVNSKNSEVRSHAITLAQSVLKYFEEHSSKITAQTYISYFTTISKCAQSEQLYFNLLEKAFHDCCRRGLLGQKALVLLCRQTPEAFMKKLLNTNVNDFRKLHVNDLPLEWSSNSTHRPQSGKDHRYTKRVTHNTGRQRIRY